jgi:hypothetical protein
MKRRPIWRILAIAASVLAVPIGAAALWIRATADRKFSAMEEKLRALEAEALRPDSLSRPGKVPGNAWDDYLAALTEASKLAADDKLIGILARTENADVAFGKAALAAHGSAVDRVVSGSRRASCVPPGRSALPALWKWETVLRLGILKARTLGEEGKTAAAVEILLALCQFGRDLGQSGVAFASHFPYWALERTLNELPEVLRGERLPAESIAEIDSRLAGLDETFPPSERMRKQQLQLVETISLPVQNAGFRAVLLSWRFGFSPRLLVGTLFEQWEHGFTRCIAADALPWPEAQAEISRLQEEIGRTPFTRFSVPSGYLSDGWEVRAARAHLRILRTATHYRATGEILDLDDPFGTKLLRRHDGARLKVWSVGLDGVDQHGAGGWSSGPAEDIVLEVAR